MALTIDIINTTLQQGNYLFATLLHEEFVTLEYNSNVDFECEANCKTSELYNIIESLQYRVSRQLLDCTTVCLYERLLRLLGTNNFNTPFSPTYTFPGGPIIIPGGNYSTFLSLTDTPDSYLGQAGRIPVVNSDETALVFEDFPDIQNLTFDNGLTLTTDNVQLGGDLVKNTTINGAGFSLQFNTSNGGRDQSAITLDSISSTLLYTNLFNGNSSTTYSSNEGILGDGTGAISLLGAYTDSSNQIVRTATSLGQGIFIKDTIDNIGLNGESLFPINNSNQYAQYGNIPASVSYTFTSGLTLTATNARLGGTLLQNTNIDGLSGGVATYNTTLTNLSNFSISAKDSAGTKTVSLSLNPSSNSFITAGQTVTSPPTTGFIGIDLDTTNRHFLLIRQGGAGAKTGDLAIIGRNNNTFDGAGPNSGFVILDAANFVGLAYPTGGAIGPTTYDATQSYAGDYMTSGIALAGDRWIPHYGAVKAYADTKFTAATIYFGTGSLTGSGTLVSPYFINSTNGLTTSGTVGVQLGGTLLQNTTISPSGFALSIDQSTTDPIILFKKSGTSVASILADGGIRGSNVANNTNSSNSAIFFNTTGTVISRNIADGFTVLKVMQNHNSSTGPLATFIRGGINTLSIGSTGGLTTQATITSVSTNAIANVLNDALLPTANGDTEVGLRVKPIFGSSTIATIDTSTFTPGSGYPSGTFTTALIGGSGSYATATVVVSGGVVTNITLISGGVNYTVADSLGIVLLDSSGSPAGSGFATTVSTITSYTGVVKISALFENAPIQLASVTTPSTLVDGMLWQDGTHLYIRLAGVTHILI